MSGKPIILTPSSTQPPVVDAPIETAQAAGSKSTAAAEPTPNAVPEVTLATMQDNFGYLSGKLLDSIPLGEISDFYPLFALSNRHVAVSARTTIRKKTITKKLLFAVAYGMESAEVNINPTTSHLFKEDIDELKESRLHNEALTIDKQLIANLIEKGVFFAEDLLKQSPEFLLERGDITDWGGRTFNNITAFEYALWAKDFKMIEMMLSCIPDTSVGNEIRAALLEQYNQVKAPIEEGGGLTYTLTYDQPCLDANGIPIRDAAGNWQTTSVTKTHTENHFDVTSLLTAYEDYDTHFDTRTWPQRDACWIKIIGTLQRLLPIHLLQRYCSPDTPFYSLPEFTDIFKRTLQFYNLLSSGWQSLLSLSLSTDISLIRSEVHWAPDRNGAAGVDGIQGGPPPAPWRPTFHDLRAIRRVDEVSTNEIEKMIRQLSQLRHSTEPRQR